jgi:hypothetical protein
MSVTSTSGTNKSNLNVDDVLNQALPGKSGGFKGVLGTIGRTAANVVLPGIGGALGRGISGGVLGSLMPGLGSDVGQYLALQQQMQQEQLAFETASTVLKIRADTSMTAVRNMSVK